MTRRPGFIAAGGREIYVPMGIIGESKFPILSDTFPIVTGTPTLPPEVDTRNPQTLPVSRQEGRSIDTDEKFGPSVTESLRCRC